MLGCDVASGVGMIADFGLAGGGGGFGGWT